MQLVLRNQVLIQAVVLTELQFEGPSFQDDDFRTIMTG